MNRTSVIEELKAAFPERSVCLAIEDWHHCFAPGDYGPKVNYRISLVPGLTGGKCDQFEASTLAQARDMALARVQKTVDPVVLDQHFETPQPPADTPEWAARI